MTTVKVLPGHLHRVPKNATTVIRAPRCNITLNINSFLLWELRIADVPCLFFCHNIGGDNNIHFILLYHWKTDLSENFFSQDFPFDGTVRIKFELYALTLYAHYNMKRSP
ncbi:hypothetical protein OS493_012474 [Desmophyllum pertusum]|uniref:Uncharacterized protein n=1 Tax=Desmophyllum pertusum TaxID=174260 RepID=A0A9X0D425_9CNID|nr:hypothetical protein OS493_012474 [Desmophyllum pertusum]